MSLAVRYAKDGFQSPRRPAGFEARNVTDSQFMAQLQGRTAEEMAARFAAGHKAYVAFIGNEPAAWGWVATHSAEIGELGSRFSIGAGERYLWNFVTRAAFRGRGIYPCLIEAIIGAESAFADRFWIAYAPENHASRTGIVKAGFRTVADLAFDSAGQPRIRALTDDGGRLAAALLGIPESVEPLTECWRCVRAGRSPHYCAPGECRCDYQKPEIVCHAG